MKQAKLPRHNWVRYNGVHLYHLTKTLLNDLSLNRPPCHAADSFASMFVNTVETTRLTYFLDSFITNRHYAMFVGNTGTSKTAIMMNKLKSMDPETMSSFFMNMNSFSDAPSLQPVIESPLEKKSGMRFGPPGNKNLVRYVLISDYQSFL